MRKNKQRELPDWDDGRTIASMNAEGMPWYQPNQSTDAPAERAGMPESSAPAEQKSAPQALTREESRAYTMGAVKAALLVVLVLCGGISLFILFCQFVWFR